jgi:hypothetical protein
MGLVFLKAIGTDRLFLYCPSCGIAWDRVPSEESPADFSVPELLAPHGSSLPSREDIDKSGWGEAIAGEAAESEYEERLWNVWAYTFLKTGNYERAIALLNKVIGTWHSPPSTAFTLRANAVDLLAAKAEQR